MTPIHVKVSFLTVLIAGAILFGITLTALRQTKQVSISFLPMIKLDDDGQLTQSQSFARDLAVLRSKIQARKMPVVWMLGDRSAVATHAANVAERFGFACLDADKIIKEEAEKENNRGKLFRAKSAQAKRVPDRIIVDVMKERMVSVGDTRGYVLAGFPNSTKQAVLFSREMTPVDCVILLQYQHFLAPASPQLHGPPSQQRPPSPNNTSSAPSLVSTPLGNVVLGGAGVMPEGDSKGVGDKRQVNRERDRERERERERERDKEKEREREREKGREREREKEEDMVKEIIVSSGGKLDLLLEKINASEPAADIFLKIEAAILDRTQTTKT